MYVEVDGGLVVQQCYVCCLGGIEQDDGFGQCLVKSYCQQWLCGGLQVVCQLDYCCLYVVYVGGGYKDVDCGCQVSGDVDVN